MSEGAHADSPTRTANCSLHARRNTRLRLACNRCQKRKIKCDGGYPSCTNCKRASVVCADGESLRLRDVPRDAEQVSALKGRILWLESIIRSRCPDIDLTKDVGLAVVDESRTTPSAGYSMAGSVERDHGEALATASRNPLTHEIGLVSVGSSEDPRYIGPSSGYFLTRMLRTSRSNGQKLDHTSSQQPILPSLGWSANIGNIQSQPLPGFQVAAKLCDAYFEVFDPQYPILNQLSVRETLAQQYNGTSIGPYASFQLFMVLALGSVTLSHRYNARISAEGYCQSALQYFDSLNLENSLPGLQCTLLLLIFAISCPHVKLNLWYLNYHCIAAVLDLGLQRDVVASTSMSYFDQEMRTRIFWVVFTLDRMIATIMGRPIGLRDEACELRLPQDIDDAAILANPDGNAVPRQQPSEMSFSIHLFRLAKLNSEIKYVANSIVRDPPCYAYPPVPNILDWQNDMSKKLDHWYLEIPQGNVGSNHINIICKLRYHSIRMLLLRPSPAIPHSSGDALKRCYESARQSIHLYNELYKSDILVYTWLTLHGLLLSTITMLYCIRAVPDIARTTEIDVLMTDLGSSLSMLSAIGEHWSAAKRSRDALEDLSGSIIQWVKEQGKRHGRGQQLVDSLSTNPVIIASNAAGPELRQYNSTQVDSGNVDSAAANCTTIEAFIPIEDSWSQFADFGSMDDSSNMNSMIQSLFEDFIPYQ